MTPKPMTQVETLKSVVLDNAKTGYKFEIRIGASPGSPDLVVWCYPFEHVDVQEDWDADPHLGEPVPGRPSHNGYDEMPPAPEKLPAGGPWATARRAVPGGSRRGHPPCRFMDCFAGLGSRA